MAGIYIHIPFCKSKCYYCDFYSTPRKDVYAAYTSALIEEWKERKDSFDNFSTLYLGGGTPSALPKKELERIFNLFDGIFFQEATLEVNPDDINSDFLKWLENSPINRISMGVQSLVDTELRNIGRRHSAEDALTAIELIKKTNFSLSLDLIYGLPGQTLESWENSLSRIISLEPEHLSCYMLSYEEGTRMELMRKRGEVKETSDERLEEFYDLLCKITAENSYEHYEISNFSKKGFRALHNSNYWNFTPYLGLGTGAHSFDGKTRSYNPKNINSYIESDGKGFNITEDNGENDNLNDYIIVRLRTSEGIDLEDFTSRFGVDEQNRLIADSQKHLESGNLILDNYSLKVKEEKWIICDSILIDLLK